MNRILIAAVFVLLSGNCFMAEADGTKDVRATLTVWLIPFDPPFATTLAEETRPVKEQLDAFNRRWAASHVTVLNTTNNDKEGCSHRVISFNMLEGVYLPSASVSITKEEKAKYYKNIE